jgi:hypothetical protein
MRVISLLVEELAASRKGFAPWDLLMLLVKSVYFHVS